MVAALTGNYRPEHVFGLRQNLEAFDYVQRQLAACDTVIDAHVQALAARATHTSTPLPTARRWQKPQGNEPRFELRTPLHRLTGVDLSQVDGIRPYTALRLAASTIAQVLVLRPELLTSSSVIVRPALPS